ncbi:hypothetical protein MN116_007823 [Schistosoma mekongi]|uniref:Uncharacterized protein n=1 Tax=Schistosoma mekongi TaxID=38744 RepID=A0AAE1Z6R2_SCHME|nr:hypothetical protein MN116_007823 [Schistosoma mekongi]
MRFLSSSLAETSYATDFRNVYTYMCLVQASFVPSSWKEECCLKIYFFVSVYSFFNRSPWLGLFKLLLLFIVVVVATADDDDDEYVDSDCHKLVTSSLFLSLSIIILLNLNNSINLIAQYSSSMLMF